MRPRSRHRAILGRRSAVGTDRRRLAGLARLVTACAVAAGTGVAATTAVAYADSVRDASWHLGYLGVADAQRVTQGEGITVAVIDTGVDGNHPDLKGNVLPGVDAYNEKGNGLTDRIGHGTEMASIIAGHGHG